ncbi:GHMP family kinase ATP-binding protein [Phytohabitans sp. LJ34]|uniref:GHMP family kinase ATP-binding protein n=1 Tax=Phytohabitans sp. LJ34 TaxID=3452217 RepID=UPI003F88D538
MTGDKGLVVASTPLRLTLGGGGTDLPFYAERFGGDMITAAVSLPVTVVARRGRVDGLFRYSYERTDVARSPDGLGHPHVSEALKAVGILEPTEIVSLGPVPSGTGLGSSGAFTVSTLAALYELAGRQPSRMELAEHAFQLENERLGRPVGRQDHYACALGGMRRLIISSRGEVRAPELDIAPDVLEALDRRLHLFYTGQRRDSAGSLHAPPTQAGLRARIEALHQIRELGARTRVALESGRLDDIPVLMSEHWELKRVRDKDGRWDEYLDVARRNGAKAGKIVGAGGGGFLLVYADPDSAPALANALANHGLRHVPFHFESQGTTVVRPSALSW